MLKLLCKVGCHQGAWLYDFEFVRAWPERAESEIMRTHSSTGISQQCNHTRICRRCGEESFRASHDVQHWESDGFFKTTESGPCTRCKQRVTREQPDTGSSGPKI